MIILVDETLLVIKPSHEECGFYSCCPCWSRVYGRILKSSWVYDSSSSPDIFNQEFIFSGSLPGEKGSKSLL